MLFTTNCLIGCVYPCDFNLPHDTMIISKTLLFSRRFQNKQHIDFISIKIKSIFRALAHPVLIRKESIVSPTLWES